MWVWFEFQGLKIQKNGYFYQTQVSSKKQGSRGFWHFRTPWLLAILSNSTSKDRFILMKNCNKNLPEQGKFRPIFEVLKIKEYFFLGKKLKKIANHYYAETQHKFSILKYFLKRIWGKLFRTVSGLKIAHFLQILDHDLVVNFIFQQILVARKDSRETLFLLHWLFRRCARMQVCKLP